MGHFCTYFPPSYDLHFPPSLLFATSSSRAALYYHSFKRPDDLPVLHARRLPSSLSASKSTANEKNFDSKDLFFFFVSGPDSFSLIVPPSFFRCFDSVRADSQLTMSTSLQHKSCSISSNIFFVSLPAEPCALKFSFLFLGSLLNSANY